MAAGRSGKAKDAMPAPERGRRRAARPTTVATPRASRTRGEVASVDHGPTALVLSNLVRICVDAPTEIPRHRATATALAAQLGGEPAFAWHLCELRAGLGDLALAPGDDDGARAEWVRERYGELIDRHRAEPLRLAALREVGDRLRQLERDGALPSTLVVRSPRPTRRRRATA